MPMTTNKAYDTLLTALEQLSMGAKKHHTNRRISANIDEQELLTIKQELEALRNDYLQKEKQARISYDLFDHKFKEAQRRLANDSRIVKGLLGPKADELMDFGIIPERVKSAEKIKSRLIPFSLESDAGLIK